MAMIRYNIDEIFKAIEDCLSIYQETGKKLAVEEMMETNISFNIEKEVVFGTYVFPGASSARLAKNDEERKFMRLSYRIGKEYQDNQICLGASKLAMRILEERMKLLHAKREYVVAMINDDRYAAVSASI